MKRLLIFWVTGCLLLAVLSGCSASGQIEDPFVYGNVSTTTDGRVNGTNGTGSARHSDNSRPSRRTEVADRFSSTDRSTQRRDTVRGTGMQGGQ